VAEPSEVNTVSKITESLENSNLIFESLLMTSFLQAENHTNKNDTTNNTEIFANGPLFIIYLLLQNTLGEHINKYTP
jgi:hypothetical protein